MKIVYTPKKDLQIHAFLLFFVLCNTQIGVGIFNFQRSIYQAAGHLAWLSVIVAGIFTHLIVWLIVRTLDRYESSDLYGIQYDLFGKGISMILNSAYLLYFLGVFTAIMRNYVEVIQAWIFPDISSWVVLLLLSILTIYAGSGGIRVIIGLCVIGFVLIVLASVLFYSPLKYAVWSQLLPLEVKEPMKILNGAWEMGFSLAGFEIIMLLYPFIRNKKRVLLHAQLGIAFSNIVYLIIMIISIVYFSSCQLERAVWPSINLLKIVKYPYLERLEFIVISLWMLVTLTGLSITMWAITRGCKRMWGGRPQVVMIIVVIVTFMISMNIEEHIQIEKFNNWIDMSTLLFSYLYPILLCFIASIVLAHRKRKHVNDEGDSS